MRRMSIQAHAEIFAVDAILERDLPKLERVCQVANITGNTVINTLRGKRSLIQLAQMIKFNAGLQHLLMLPGTDFSRTPPLEPNALPLESPFYLTGGLDILRALRGRRECSFFDVSVIGNTTLDRCIWRGYLDLALMYMSLGCTQYDREYVRNPTRIKMHDHIRTASVMLAIMQGEHKRMRPRMPEELWRRVRVMLFDTDYTVR